MNESIFETKTFLQTVKVYNDRVEVKEPLKSSSIPLSSIASIDTGFKLSYDFFIETNGGEWYKLLVKSGDKNSLKEAIFAAKSA